MANDLLMVWSDCFVTDIKKVDDQHLYLVGLVNQLGSALLKKTVTFASLSKILEQLLEYTKFHFSSEEKLMAEKKLYHLSVTDHYKNHRFFVQEIVTLCEELKDDDQVFQRAKSLLDFLINWLAFHILEQDQFMARQIKLMDQGMDAKSAYEEIVNQGNGQAEPLVQALKGIFNVLSARNHELIELKNNLEIKVQERTEKLIRANQELERISVTDPLTRLYNRRYAMSYLKRLNGENRRDGEILSCLMIDIDFFKPVNDTYGHDAGDRVLIEVATTIKRSVRADDIVCRMGGDEFMVICPHTALEGGIQVAKKILAGLNSLKIVLDEQGHFYQGSASIGVADSEGKNLFNIMKEADKFVYEAKRAGRNCVRFPVSS